MKQAEYIGISGVVNQEQQNSLEEIFNARGLAGKRVLQLGIKATHKTQYLNIENKYGRAWYPVGDEIKAAVNDSAHSTRVAQICFDEEQVHNYEYREAFLYKLLGRASWTGVQFDMLPDWCTAHGASVAQEVMLQSHQLVDDWRPATVTLQCQAEVMQQHTPAEIAGALADLRGLSYVLFDASGGRGVRMNTNRLLPYLDAVRSNPQLDTVGIAVGGGLNAEVVRTELPKILRHFPDVSWDAEGQLHPVNTRNKRPLDMQVCREYIEACADVLD